MDTLVDILPSGSAVALIHVVEILEPELKTSNRTTLCLTNVKAAVCPMDGEVTSQLISSDGADMATEVESDLSLSGDEVSVTEEVHPLHIRVDK